MKKRTYYVLMAGLYLVVSLSQPNLSWNYWTTLGALMLVDILSFEYGYGKGISTARTSIAELTLIIKQLMDRAGLRRIDAIINTTKGTVTEFTTTDKE